MERSYATSTSEATVRVEPQDAGYRVTVGERAYRVNVLRDEQGALTLEIDGRITRVAVAAEGARRWVTLNGTTYLLEPGGRRGRSRAAPAQGKLTAVMPGQVVAVHVATGDAVQRGQPLVVITAMKMEQTITAPAAGQVRAVYVAAGDVVAKGQMLVEVEIDLSVIIAPRSHNDP